MEPPLPPLHPKVPILLDQLDLRIIDAVKWNLLLCTGRSDEGSEPTAVLKIGSDRRKSESMAYETKIMREVLPSIDASMFERLVLPELISDGSTDGVRWILMKYIKGDPLIYKWSELAFKADILGGKGLDAGMASACVDVLRDLRLVDIMTMPDYVRKFSFAEWLEGFKAKSDAVVKFGLMDRTTVDSARALFETRKTLRYEGNMFTNGDFYPRNFIALDDGRIAVVDWDAGIDPWEFAAMYAWLLMWGSPEWQAAYVREIARHFPVDIDEMQVGMLVKAFDQVYLWRNEPEENIGFARTQMLSYFRQALDRDYVRSVFV
jgi:hypothetical protein